MKFEFHLQYVIHADNWKEAIEALEADLKNGSARSNGMPVRVIKALVSGKVALSTPVGMEDYALSPEQIAR